MCAAFTYLSVRSDIASARIGAFSIFASGSYVPFATQTDHRIKAISTISAIRIGSSIYFSPAARNAVLDQVRRWRVAEVRRATQRRLKPKELYWVKGAAYIDLYDEPELVPGLVAKLTDFFRKNL